MSFSTDRNVQELAARICNVNPLLFVVRGKLCAPANDNALAPLTVPVANDNAGFNTVADKLSVENIIAHVLALSAAEH